MRHQETQIQQLQSDCNCWRRVFVLAYWAMTSTKLGGPSWSRDTAQAKQPRSLTHFGRSLLTCLLLSKLGGVKLKPEKPWIERRLVMACVCGGNSFTGWIRARFRGTWCINALCMCPAQSDARSHWSQLAFSSCKRLAVCMDISWRVQYVRTHAWPWLKRYNLHGFVSSFTYDHGLLLPCGVPLISPMSYDHGMSRCVEITSATSYCTLIGMLCMQLLSQPNVDLMLT